MRISEKIKITNDMVIKFAEVTGDINPLHLDDEYSKNTIFKKRIVHGMLLVSFFSKLIANKYPGEGSIYLQQDVKFKNPCYIDDEIEVIIELVKNENNKFFLSTEIIRNDLSLVTGNAVVLKNKTVFI